MCEGFSKFLRCGNERSDPISSTFCLAVLIGTVMAVIFAPFGISITTQYRRCECLAETEWLRNCPDGISYGYNFSITCPAIETFNKPNYVTPCEDSNRIERYRWEVGVEETCWIVLGTKASAINAGTGGNRNSTNDTEPTPPVTHGEVGYDVEEISRNSLGLGIIIAASVFLGIAIIGCMCVCVWAKSE